MNKKSQSKVWNPVLGVALAGLAVAGSVTVSDACTRILYETGSKDFIVGRSMDWADNTQTNLWAFPKGMERNGGVGEGSFTWTSKYGSVIATIYDVATVDGMNEAGLVGNVLYLAESDYGPADAGKPKMSVGGWLQYVLDSFATVSEAVDALKADPFTVVAPNLPNGKAATGHVALSDPSGDSAIFEYLDGKLVIHQGPQTTVMTNSPPYDQQLAINTYWTGIGGSTFLPGTNRAADRFVRASYFLSASPKFEDKRTALASVASMVRAVSVPVGVKDPSKPNIATTQWRTYADQGIKRYYYDSVFNPGLFWVDLDKLDLSEGAATKKLDLTSFPILAGEVSGSFQDAKPFKFLAP
ncbi:linear amide C-N hydrolase [Methyloceanibacter caenitepidi]|uniref:Choloylglycine hydrolase n=1 Tax=Methyloceanibacter caenitepidi TaxID=1384459 RepID=A0A0A8JZH5_9HYPH|nr:linear amide C-N hydrolase [Methyloceanibacter caenitepidi]BAQ16218.1 choloylglycine hydrolase [Methyloceanibacter caenitepidi]